MAYLNYHHLRYFHQVAHCGTLTQAAEMLNLSQSALSIQIKTLEAQLGHALFDRVGRRLELTEVGRMTLDHADRIFATGDELLATLDRSGAVRVPLRVGALSTLSRNFQLQFLAPVLGREDVDLVLKSGRTPRLLEDLAALNLDVVLTTEPPATTGKGQAFEAHRLAEQNCGLHGVPDRLRHGTLDGLLRSEPLILPTDTAIRTGFDLMVTRMGLTPRIVADVDDMAMVRLLAREGAGVALAPAVVFADEIASGRIASAEFDLEISEPFYAVTRKRNFPNPYISDLLKAH